MKLKSLQESLTARIYYHGTSFGDRAKMIMDSGYLKGAEVQGSKRLSPIANRVYLTEQLHYAVIYALGGEYQGAAYAETASFNGGEYGYVFLVRPSDLKNPLPDEDSIGEFIHKFARRKDNTPDIIKALTFLKKGFTPHQYEQSIFGDYSMWAAGGKRALKTMPADVANIIINSGGHISNEGIIRPYEGWRIEKKLAGKLDKKSSNFFDLATKVWEQ